LAFSLDSYTPPNLPELTADWKDRQVELKWQTLEFRDNFFGWMVEKTVNGGTPTELFELPIINDYDTIQRESDALKYIFHTDNLSSNSDSITYRLWGHDYLGGRSKNYVEISGSGLADIEYSPLLTKTMQTDSNYAIIQWEFDQEQEPLVAEFRIIHTDSLNGEYDIALQGIAREVRQAAIPMKYRSNYYRVQAVSITGTVYSSFESLVLAYDDEPPAMPRDFQGYIDSAGIAHLSWVTSNEPDLKGYYLFKSYFPDAEFAMITPKSIPGPTHLDTTKVTVAHETIYYQLRSVDFRGNSSNFTPVLELRKPDIYPPAAPQIINVDNDGKKVTLQWVKSPSDDVVSYTLFRQEPSDSPTWNPILTFSAAAFQRRYVDSLVQPGTVYAYSLQATDDDGLVSERSQPISLTLKDFGLRSPIEDVSATAQADDKSILLSWTYAETPREFYLYKGIDDRPVSLLKVISGNAREFVDAGIRKGPTYKYLLRAVFPNGKVSPFTEEVRVKLE
ncbi:MAG: fibronectin type III domain-containing protein, partial [Bacteroidota bacterium]